MNLYESVGPDCATKQRQPTYEIILQFPLCSPAAALLCCRCSPVVSPWYLLSRWFDQPFQENGAFLEPQHPRGTKQYPKGSRHFARRR